MKTAATDEKSTAIVVQGLPGQRSVAELERQAAAGERAAEGLRRARAATLGIPREKLHVGAQGVDEPS